MVCSTGGGSTAVASVDRKAIKDIDPEVNVNDSEQVMTFNSQVGKVKASFSRRWAIRLCNLVPFIAVRIEIQKSVLSISSNR